LTFGLSRVFWLTFVALALTGATDSISMIIRNTIRQILTPDILRGRMTSVNQMFFRGGPLFGEVEAGIVAQWFGAPFAVVSGGIACLLSVGFIAARYPQLRAYNGDEPIVAGHPVPQASN
jgi:MFS family permease